MFVFLADEERRIELAGRKAIHLAEEGRPVETAWEVTVAATAHARSIPNIDKRLDMEREAGALLNAA